MLHIDKNDYYGGAEAALSLQEVESWAATATEGKESLYFSSSATAQYQQVHASDMLQLKIWREKGSRSRKETALQNWDFLGHTASRYRHS